MNNSTTVTLTGNVTGLFFNELPEPDKFGNTIRPVLMLDSNIRISYPSNKKKALNISNGTSNGKTNWHILNVGDRISAKVEEVTLPDGKVFYNGRCQNTQLDSATTSKPRANTSTNPFVQQQSQSNISVINQKYFDKAVDSLLLKVQDATPEKIVNLYFDIVKAEQAIINKVSNTNQQQSKHVPSGPTKSASKSKVSVEAIDNDLDFDAFDEDFIDTKMML